MNFVSFLRPVLLTAVTVAFFSVLSTPGQSSIKLLPLPTFIPRPTSKPLPTATPRPTAKPTATPRPTATPVPTATPRPTATPIPTPRPTATASPTATATATATAIPTATPLPIPTATAVPNPVPTSQPGSGTNAYPIPALAQTEVFNSVSITTKVIALTFDDGPQPGTTEQILAILAQNKVKATFFQIGNNLSSNAALGRSIRDAGHAIGNHTLSHLETPADPTSEVKSADTIFQGVYGGPTALFRPPFGNFDNGVVQAAQAQNDAIIIWSVDPKDWSMPGTDSIVNTVLSGATPGGIVLMHDGGGDRSQTIAALPRIISGLRAQGYSFATVPELLAMAYGPPIITPGQNQPPTVTLIAPGSYYSYLSLTASGTVTDAETSVKSVQATLRRFSDAQFWNGSTFGTASTSLPATLSGTNWSLPLSSLPDGRYTIAVTATDSVGVSSNPIARDFWIDNQPPTVTITTPTNGQSSTSLPAASGTTSDNGGGGVASVGIALMRSDGFWWNGSAWSPNYGEASAILSSGTTWTFAMPTLTNGNYNFYAKGIDYVGNIGPWARADFSIAASGQTSTAARSAASIPAPSATPSATKASSARGL